MSKSRYLKNLFCLLLSLGSINSQANENNEAAAFTVQISANIINVTGIQTLLLKRSQYRPEIETFATRVNLAPLIDTRKDYFTALAEKEKAAIILRQSRKNSQHLKNLQRESAVSTRKLLAQKTQLALDEANFKAVVHYADNLYQHTRSTWGTILSRWFLTAEPPYSNMLGALNQAVYLINLPTSFTSPLNTLFIHPTGLREKALSAHLISAAPAYSVQQQPGTPYFYLSEQADSGYPQRAIVWIPLNETKISGFIIPASAIVWHLGQAYAYLQVEEELFRRIKINQKKKLSTGTYFIPESLQENDRLVITGAQMLLSEEFRAQIPAEDDDDDDDDDDD